MNVSERGKEKKTMYRKKENVKKKERKYTEVDYFFYIPYRYKSKHFL